MQQPQQEAFVVTVIPAQPAAETTVADVIIGSLGVTGVLVLLALVLGVFAGGIRMLWNRLHPPSDDHLPPVTPAQAESSPSSSQARPAS